MCVGTYLGYLCFDNSLNLESTSQINVKLFWLRSLGPMWCAFACLAQLKCDFVTQPKTHPGKKLSKIFTLQNMGEQISQS